MASLLVPLIARGEGKCDDDPYYWPGQKMLIATWMIPYPADATLVEDDPADADLMADLDKALGAEPPGFPPEHGNPSQNPYPPKPTAKEFPHYKDRLATLDEVKAFLGDFKMRVEPEAEEYFTDYLTNKKTVMHARVVQHPPDGKNGVGFRFCTCILQRAVAIWDGDTEQLLVKSTFRSFRNYKTKPVVFAPTKPVKFTFPRKTIWFPLAFNTIIPEPGVSAFLLLDVLTNRQLDLAKTNIPFGLGVQQRPFAYRGANWFVTRIWSRYQRGDQADDLDFTPVFH